MVAAAAVFAVVVVAACESDNPVSPNPSAWRWSWEQPRPTGATIRGIGGWTEFDQWAVGDGGLVMRYRGLGWSPVFGLPTGRTFYDVVAFSSSEAFIVGEAGTIISVNGSPQNSTTTNDLYSLFGFSSGNLIAVGAAGTIVTNDGGGWQTANSPTPNDLYGVWCLDDGEKVAVGAGGVVIRSNAGGPWALDPAFTTRDLNAVWADKPGDWFAVGNGGEIWQDRGAGWIPMASPRGDDFYDVFGSDSAYVFAVGDADSILFYDQISWRPVAPNPSGHLDAIWATLCPLGAATSGARGSFAAHCSNTYFAGAGGLVTRYTLFNTYEAMTDVLTLANVRGIHGRSSGDLYAVGDGGTVLRNDGTAWTLSPTGLTEALNDVFVASPLEVFVVGDVGLVLRGADDAWTPLTSGTTSNLRGVWADFATRAFAVGDAGTILHFDGVDWNPEAAPVADYADVWGFASGEVVAVGSGGVIAENETGDWSTMTSPVGTGLRGVWGTSLSNAFAVGDAGVILHLGNDGQWRATTAPVFDDWVAVSGSGGVAWAVGARGHVLRHDGSMWNLEETLPVEGLGGVFVRSAERVFVTGSLGAVIRFRLESTD